MLYYNFMETLRKNEYFLTRDIIREIKTMPEAPHYRAMPDDALYGRVHKIIYHAYKRHSAWLTDTASRNAVFSHYSEIGRLRFREDIPLDEVVRAFLAVKAGVFGCIAGRIPLDTDYTPGQTGELFMNIGLFFDRIILAVISGYRKEMTARSCA